MNLKEYAAVLDDPELCHEARQVYLVFRRYMDFETGVVGRRRIVDYNELRQSLEYLPARGSKDKPKRYSKDQIKRYIKTLVDRGFLVRLHDSGLRQAMVFKLPLASCDLNRLNEDRHETATRGAPLPKVDAARDASDLNATGAPPDEGHISDISENSLSGAKNPNFEMYQNWTVADGDRVEMMLAGQGFSYEQQSDFDRGVLLEMFVDYWVGRGDRSYCQRQWEVRFVEHVAHTLKKWA